MLAEIDTAGYQSTLTGAGSAVPDLACTNGASVDVDA